MKIPKEFRPLAAHARAQRWTIRRTNGGHLCWQSPQGRKVFSPSTPSDHRALANVKRKLKHKGMKFT